VQSEPVVHGHQQACISLHCACCTPNDGRYGSPDSLCSLTATATVTCGSAAGQDGLYSAFAFWLSWGVAETALNVITALLFGLPMHFMVDLTFHLDDRIWNLVWMMAVFIALYLVASQLLVALSLIMPNQVSVLPTSVSAACSECSAASVLVIRGARTRMGVCVIIAHALWGHSEGALPLDGRLTERGACCRT